MLYFCGKVKKSKQTLKQTEERGEQVGENESHTEE
jgi:hypothetical protein